jgi:putative FmdB family regulatory protein
MTYEYVCTACGHAWEAEQSISEAALKTCPNCHEQTARRQISGGAGFILKGGGWYSDLYGSTPKKSGGGDEAKSETKSDTSSKDSGSKKDGSSNDKGSSGSSGSSSSSSGTPTPSAPPGSKATSAASGA